MSETAQKDAGIQSLSDVETVVDCDFHLTEHQEDFLPYIDDPFRELLHREDAPMGYLKSFYPSSGLFTPVSTGKTDMGSVRTRDAVLEGMELLDVDRAIVTPTLNLYLSIVHHDDLAVALMRAYNEWVLDEIFDPDQGVYGPVTVALHKPDRAAEEIDRLAGEDAITSVFVPSGGVHPPLGNERYYPIYEAAEEHGLPVQFHAASGTQILNFPLQFLGTNRYMSNHAPTHPMIHMMHLTDMIVRGVPVRFPDLNVVIEESGIGWIPFMMRRLDNEYNEKRQDAPMLEKPPSEYIRDNFYATSQPIEGADDADYISSIVRLLGPENLLFSSDYPHLDFDHSDYLFNALLRNFEDGEVEGVYGATALDIFDF